MHIAFLFLWHLASSLRLAHADDTNTTPLPPPVYSEAIDNGTFGYYPIRTYATAEDITSPQTNFLQWSSQCDDGLLHFITPRGWSLPLPGPMILDRHGELVWSKHFDNKFGGQAYDFMVQRYQEQDFLTFWLGDDRVRGHGSGFYYMLNSSYDVVHKVGAANGLSADLHEFLVTPRGTALMTMYEIARHDVMAFRDFDPTNPEDQDPNYIWDCVFQEVTVDTQELVFEWRASDHLSINETYHGIGPGGTKHDPFDWFHINSIAKDELGNYLISARYTHSITYVDGKTGDIIWTLGGKSNSFMDLSDGFALNFAWQHDARFLPTDTFPNMYTPPTDRPGYTTKLISLFDNAAEDQHYEYGLTYSRGLLLEVVYPNDGTFVQKLRDPAQSKRQEDGEPDLNIAKIREINGTDPDYTVRVVKSYENPRGVRSSSQGSLQVIPQDGRDAKVLVGYGLNALWTEFEANGTVLCDVHFGADVSWERGDIQSYRAYKFPWTGHPETRPSVDISDDDVEVYVSWNGATDVADWILQCSDNDTDKEQAWADVVRVTKSGFETVIPIPENGLGDARYLRVIALTGTGRRLDYGISEAIDRGLMATYLPLMNAHLPNGVLHMSLTKGSLILMSTLSGMFLLYEVYRRYLIWKMGRPGGHPLRWRQGPSYRLLGTA
ncbi:hypothetical protein LTR08_007544 [Meristemomyces frigidus]|nr:hypothetical protein LTR08_007544 [Meristemomyces frigidus]